MRKLPWFEMKINVVHPKSLYLQQMKSFHEAMANKRRERELHVCWKEMHTHMRKTELKEEEEELKQHDKTLKRHEEELRIREEQLEKRKKKRVMSFYCTLYSNSN
jgi:hypothetical protein